MFWCPGLLIAHLSLRLISTPSCTCSPKFALKLAFLAQEPGFSLFKIVWHSKGLLNLDNLFFRSMKHFQDRLELDYWLNCSYYFDAVIFQILWFTSVGPFAFVLEICFSLEVSDSRAFESWAPFHFARREPCSDLSPLKMLISFPQA